MVIKKFDIDRVVVDNMLFDEDFGVQGKGEVDLIIVENYLEKEVTITKEEITSLPLVTLQAGDLVELGGHDYRVRVIFDGYISFVRE